MIRVFQCEDSLTGILTGVYDGWASRLGHSHVRLAILDQGNMELFREYEEVMAWIQIRPGRYCGRSGNGWEKTPLS